MNVLKTEKMKRSQTIFLLFFISVAVVSCKYDFIKKPEPINPGMQVSFSNDILPIFNNNNKCTGCHKPGGEMPDYTPPNAYNSIMENNVVNTTTPASSSLYTVPDPTTSGHTWQKYTSNEAQMVLLWIEQGALNN
jgi:hypothetical protein